MTGAGLDWVLRRLYAGEQRVAEHLLAMADRHPDDPEIRHVSLDLASWSRDNLEAIAASIRDYDRAVGPSGDALQPDPQAAAEPPPLALLDDLRRLHLLAADTGLGWEALKQYAQAKRDQQLLELSQRCHPQTLRQMKWANTMLKTLSPQALTSLD
jgi:hypothetical protein